MIDLESNIRQAVHLPRQMGSGFWSTNCAVCGETQGRGGFKFDADGSIAYHCFKGACDASAVFKPEEGLTFKFKKVLKAFGVDIPPELLLESAAKRRDAKQKEETELDYDLYMPHRYETVELPEGFMRFDPKIHGAAAEYLRSRFLSLDDEYYIGAGYWYNRLIVPCRYYNRLVGWQAVRVGPGPALLFEKFGNTDLLFFPGGHVPDEPLVVEGYADALSIPDGVACFQSKITKKQAYFLRNTRPILVPDRLDSEFLEVARTYKWRLAVPPWQEKDANDAMKRYGRLVIAEMIRDNVYTNLTTAEMKYAMWADNKNKKKARATNTFGRRTTTHS